MTVSGRSPGAAVADIVIETGELDQSWCHSVGYVSPMVAAPRSAPTSPAGPLDADAIARAAWRRAAAGRAGAERIAEPAARRRAPARSSVASGADRPAGRELALKVEEASWLPSAYRDLETFLHGHLAGDRRPERASS